MTTAYPIKSLLPHLLKLEGLVALIATKKVEREGLSGDHQEATDVDLTTKSVISELSLINCGQSARSTNTWRAHYPQRIIIFTSEERSLWCYVNKGGF